jgi:hypothetical protein
MRPSEKPPFPREPFPDEVRDSFVAFVESCGDLDLSRPDLDVLLRFHLWILTRSGTARKRCLTGTVGSLVSPWGSRAAELGFCRRRGFRGNCPSPACR